MPASRPSVSFQRCRVCGWDVVTDGVVDHGAAADALALQYLEASVRRHLQAAVVQEVGELDALVLAEVPRVDVLAALQQDDLPAGLGEPVGEDRAGRAAADDRDVGSDSFGVDLVRLAHLEGGELADPLDDLLVALALRERDVAGRGGRARIGVVADDHHLLRAGEDPLTELAQRAWEPALDRHR